MVSVDGCVCVDTDTISPPSRHTHTISVIQKPSSFYNSHMRAQRTHTRREREPDRQVIPRGVRACLHVCTYTGERERETRALTLMCVTCTFVVLFKNISLFGGLFSPVCPRSFPQLIGLLSLSLLPLPVDVSVFPRGQAAFGLCVPSSSPSSVRSSLSFPLPSSLSLVVRRSNSQFPSPQTNSISSSSVPSLSKERKNEKAPTTLLPPRPKLRRRTPERERDALSLWRRRLRGGVLKGESGGVSVRVCEGERSFLIVHSLSRNSR